MRGGQRRAITIGLECAAVLLALVAASATYVVVESEDRLGRRYSAAAPRLAIPDDPKSLARGRHLATHVALCTWCHGEDLSGKQTADDPWMGRLHASNLTRGAGGIGHYDALDFDRAVRYGVAPNGRSLLLMPSRYLATLHDEDLAAIFAWIATAKPVDAERPATHAGPLTRIALVTGLAPELISAEFLESKVQQEDRGLGAYLVDIAACRVCHHENLEGGLHPLALPGEPPPPDLTASGPLTDWSFDDFETAMRTGRRPDGRSLSPEYMPWPHYAGMSDEELRAIWSYLERL